MDTSLHQIQSEILIYLLFQKEARFSELNRTQVTTDHFNFHVQRLLELKLIQKNDKDRYELTIKGKEYANRYDDEKKQIERQPKVSVLVLGIKKINGITHILMQQRLKHPSYGYHGFITGKVRFGETMHEAADRELMEETGLTGKLEFMGVEHKMDYNNEGQILEDKIFLMFKVTALKGNFIGHFKGGKNTWMELSQVELLDSLFDDVLEILSILKSKKLHFLEKKYTVKRY